MDSVGKSYFRGLNTRLSLPVVLGSAILILYYAKLLQLNAEQLSKTLYFAAVAIPLSLLWPIPLNRPFIAPVIRYLKGNGSASEAEHAASLFPLRSALLSLASWFIAGFGIVYYSIRILRIPETYGLYLFVGAVSAGLAASFVHFHIVRKATGPIRVRIHQDLGNEAPVLRYPILLKLLLSFTMLIALALTFFALMGHAHTEEALRTGVMQASNWWDTLWLILAIVGLGGLVAYFAASDISGHVNQIKEAAQRIAAGEFGHPLHMVSDDEVASLAASINRMAEELQHKIELLQKARDDAQEKKVLLEQANEELRQLDELKSNFLANISHELKAPLVSTKGYIDFILSGRMGPINEKQHKGLNVSRDNLNHLSRLITSLLDFSKVSAGTMKLKMEACSLRELVESCAESIKIEIGRNNKEIQVLTQIAGEPRVFCDSDRIREVLMNLLTNAEKFTPSPGTIHVVVEPSKADEGFVNVSVIDTGIGIPREHHTKIFQRFYQVDGSSTRKYGGTGLGLAIVKEILESHNCKIQVESTLQGGSKFTFTLPLHLHSEVATELQPVAAKRHHAAKLVEVVEDDVHVSGMIKVLLEEQGFAVIPARSGRDALRIAREHKPDLITLDIYLPDMNGFDLLQKLHSDPVTSAIPVVVLSILADQAKGEHLGVLDYLEKPIDLDRLRQVLLKAASLIDAQGSPLKIMVVDDDRSTLEFFEDCLSTEGYEVSTVEGGKHVLERAKTESPALILLDLIMPDCEGLDVLRQLKSENTTRDIPVIVLTGKAGLEEQNQSLKLGAESVLAKPVEIKNIIDQVKKHFGASMG